MNVEQQNTSALIYARNKPVAEEYSLLLNSLGINNGLIFVNNSWAIEVGAVDFNVAYEEISNYEKSGRIAKVKNRFAHIRFQKLNYFYFFSTLIALTIFHFIVHGFPELNLIKSGRSSASAITEGEIYRAVTGLTLHADIKHLFSNVVFGGIAVFSLATLLGTGLSWVLFLMSGFFGNVLNAYFYGSAHNSIGASTAVFGTIGVLAGLQLFEKFREKKSYAWIPFGAALGLLAMLGSSENTDFMAHLFGFVSGIPIGAAAGAIYSKKEIPQKAFQLLTMALFWSILISSWMEAVL
ncbi:MAG: rhomboid family intramembrane serine protease [bacterium]